MFRDKKQIKNDIPQYSKSHPQSSQQYDSQFQDQDQQENVMGQQEQSQMANVPKLASQDFQKLFRRKLGQTVGKNKKRKSKKHEDKSSSSQYNPTNQSKDDEHQLKEQPQSSQNQNQKKKKSKNKDKVIKIRQSKQDQQTLLLRLKIAEFVYVNGNDYSEISKHFNFAQQKEAWFQIRTLFRKAYILFKDYYSDRSQVLSNFQQVAKSYNLNVRRVNQSINNALCRISSLGDPRFITFKQFMLKVYINQNGGEWQIEEQEIQSAIKVFQQIFHEEVRKSSQNSNFPEQKRTSYVAHQKIVKPNLAAQEEETICALFNQYGKDYKLIAEDMAKKFIKSTVKYNASLIEESVHYLLMKGFRQLSSWCKSYYGKVPCFLQKIRRYDNDFGAKIVDVPHSFNAQKTKLMKVGLGKESLDCDSGFAILQMLQQTKSIHDTHNYVKALLSIQGKQWIKDFYEGDKTQFEEDLENRKKIYEFHYDIDHTMYGKKKNKLLYQQKPKFSVQEIEQDIQIEVPDIIPCIENFNDENQDCLDAPEEDGN